MVIGLLYDVCRMIVYNINDSVEHNAACTIHLKVYL